MIISQSEFQRQRKEKEGVRGIGREGGKEGGKKGGERQTEKKDRETETVEE